MVDKRFEIHGGRGMSGADELSTLQAVRVDGEQKWEEVQFERRVREGDWRHFKSGHVAPLHYAPFARAGKVWSTILPSLSRRAPRRIRTHQRVEGKRLP